MVHETLRLWTTDEKPADEVPELLENRQPVEIRQQEVIWGGYLATHYGHFLTESVSRLWPLLGESGEDDRPVVLVGPRQRPSFADDWLEAFGVDLVDLPPHETVLFDRMAVPEPAWRLNAWAAPEIRRIHLRARENMDIPFHPASRLLWLSRRRLGLTRAAYDERLLEWLLRDHASVISPETLSLADQVGLMEGSDLAAGIVGSAFHTLLLTESPPKCIFLCAGTVAPAYVAQAELTKSNSAFVNLLEPVPLGGAKRPRFPAGYRVMVPEALHALSQFAPELLDSPEIQAVVGKQLKVRTAADPGLVKAMLAVIRSPYAASCRLELGERFEDAGDPECAAEQFLAAADFSDDPVITATAARLLERIGEEDPARRASEREPHE